MALLEGAASRSASSCSRLFEMVASLERASRADLLGSSRFTFLTCSVFFISMIASALLLPLPNFHCTKHNNWVHNSQLKIIHTTAYCYGICRRRTSWGGRAEFQLMEEVCPTIYRRHRHGIPQNNLKMSPYRRCSHDAAAMTRIFLPIQWNHESNFCLAFIWIYCLPARLTLFYPKKQTSKKNLKIPWTLQMATPCLLSAQNFLTLPWFDVLLDPPLLWTQLHACRSRRKNACNFVWAFTRVFC